MRVSILFFTVLLVSLSACETITSIDEQEISFMEGKELRSRMAPHPRPFKGTVLSGFSDGTDIECDCGDLIVTNSSGTGKLTHMGKVTEVTRVCVEEFFFDENDLIIGASVARLCVRLIAANGDELTVEGDPHLILNDPDNLFARAEFTVHFVGGTGRFEDAAGSANVVTTLDLTTNEFTEVYDGVIYY